MVAAVRHHHVPRGLGGDGEALGSVQRAAGRVHVGEEGAELVEHLQVHCSAVGATGCVITCTLELPQSATRMLSWQSTATPVGALN